MKTEHIIQVYPIPSTYDGRQEAEYIDDDEVLCYRWYIVHLYMDFPISLQNYSFYSIRWVYFPRIGVFFEFFYQSETKYQAFWSHSTLIRGLFLNFAHRNCT